MAISATCSTLKTAKECTFTRIRLRDLGGIIIIDFIDMDERRNRQEVMQLKYYKKLDKQETDSNRRIPHSFSHRQRNP